MIIPKKLLKVLKSYEKMPEKVLKSPDLGFLEKRGDPVWEEESVLAKWNDSKVILLHKKGNKS